MKRRSMLGQRSRAVQQPPLSPAFPSQPSIPERNSETPRPPNRNITSPHPFQTPSVDGSLSDLSSRATETWSVFKKCNVRGLKSPVNGGGRRMNVEAPNGHSSRLNRLKKKDPLCELRNFGFSNILSKKNGVSSVLGSGFTQDRTLSTVAPSALSHGFKSDKYKLHNDVKRSVEPKGNNAAHQSEESEQERVARELLNLQKKFENQDIRVVSPPWCNGPNALSDFNLITPREIPSVTVSSPPKSPHKLVDFSSTLGVVALEATVVDRKDEVAEEKTDASFTELETMVNEENDVSPHSLDLSSVLGNVSLGVNTVELLDKPNMANLSKTTWGIKYKSPFLAVTEEPELSLVGKENAPPGDDTDEFCSPPTSNETVKFISEAGSPRTQSSRQFKEFQSRLEDISSKIEAVEEKRLQVEEERKFLEGERKRIFVDFHKFMERSGNEPLLQASGKRSKLAPSSAKKATRPSVVASKLIKKDFKSPKDNGSIFRTPSQVTECFSTSVLIPLTPRSLRNNLNEQFNSIFGS